jgi:Phytanoyl-CoA dioxygenase (PhyH)
MLNTRERTGREELAEHGFALISQLLTEDQCEAVAAHLTRNQSDAAGTRRMLSQPWCQLLARTLQQHPALSELLPAGFVAVQCTYFEKSISQNWLVAMHQDLTIPVAVRVDHHALGVWSEKEGVIHVQAPIELLEQLVAVRIHIDGCGINDGPLRVIPGSHRFKRIGVTDAVTIRRASPEKTCTGDRGSAVVLRPLLLHASSKTHGTNQRRVLHFLYGPAELPFGLRWHQT